MYVIAVPVKDIEMDELYARVEAIGIRLEEIVEDRSEGESILYVYTEDKAEVLEVRARLEAEGIPVELSVLEDKTWKNKWKESAGAVRISDDMRIVPVWTEVDAISGVRDIKLDTELVFGAGTHPTTLMSAVSVRALAGKYEDIFDIGTGTGILCIVAFLCGAKKVWGIDLLEEAVITAAGNLALNGVKAELLEVADIAFFEKDGVFDLVTVNILTAGLLKCREKIVSYVRPGGYLVVSGVSSCNYDEFRDRFDGSDIKAVDVIVDRGWYAITYSKVRERV